MHDHEENLTEEVLRQISKEHHIRERWEILRPSGAFIGASWFGLFLGMLCYCIGLWNVQMELNEKGYYFTLLLFGLFSVISVQKSVRDRMEGMEVTDIYYGLSWFATLSSLILLLIGLWNVDLSLSEKGFYGISFCLSLFCAIAIQKNTRDLKMVDKLEQQNRNENTKVYENKE